MYGTIRSLSARPFAEPWPERPAAKRRKRENGRLRRQGAMRSVSASTFAEPWPERVVAKSAKNGNTSVDTTGHLSVRALCHWSVLALRIVCLSHAVREARAGRAGERRGPWELVVTD